MALNGLIQHKQNKIYSCSISQFRVCDVPTPRDTWAGERSLSFQDHQHLPDLSRLAALYLFAICYVTTPLTNLQLWVHLIKTPVDVAVTMGFLKEIVQNIPCHLTLIHHQRLCAVIVHVHLDNKLRTKSQKSQLISEARRRLV